MGKLSTPIVPEDDQSNLGREKEAIISEASGRKLDFYSIRTTLDIRPGTYGTPSQDRLNALIEVIGLRAQPIIVSMEPVATEKAPNDLPVAGKKSVSVYEMKFALEHFGAWEGAVPTLAESLNGIMGFVHEHGADDNVSVIRYAPF